MNCTAIGNRHRAARAESADGGPLPRRRHTTLQDNSGVLLYAVCFFFSSRRRHTRLQGDWSSDVCSSDLKFCQSVFTPSARLVCSMGVSAYRLEFGVLELPTAASALNCAYSFALNKS